MVATRIDNRRKAAGPVARITTRTFNEQFAWPAGSFILVMVAWEVTADLGVLNKMFFASPTAIIAAGVHDVHTSLFWSDVWVSSKEFLLGYVIALGVGLTFGFAIGWFLRFGYFFRPWVDSLNAMPSIALVPLVLIWFGIGLSSKVALIFLTAVIPIIVNVYTGTSGIDRRYFRVAVSFGASRVYLFRSVVGPSIAPFAFAAARIGVGRAVSGVVVGELFAAKAGLAFRLFQQAQTLKTAQVLFGALAITFLALGAFRLVGVTERRTLRWRGVT